jgi:integrase
MTIISSPDLKSLGTGSIYLIRRQPSRIFYAENLHGERISLRTTDRSVAEEILRGHKASVEKPNFAYKVALAYLGETDPEAQNRTWLDVIDAYIKRSAAGPTRLRLETAKKDKALQKILKLNVLQDRPRQAGLFFEALNAGGVSTNVYLRRFHNFAIDMGWIAAPIIPRRQWPKVRYAKKKAITEEQYLRIIDREQNPEKKAFYQLLWHLGGSQTDIAILTGEAIDWTNRTVNFPRKKNHQTCAQRFGDECAAVLEKLPKRGLLLPSIARLGEGDRATYFTRRCKTLGIQGISLHSFRYSWAERAAAVGMPERFAMMALGHKSRAIHQAYTKNLDPTIDSLEILTKKRQGELPPPAPVIRPDFQGLPPSTPSDAENAA